MLLRKNNKEIGNKAESFAAHLLQKKGYTILHTNFRTKSAEIDIIAKDKDTLVFVEVKFRKNNAKGSPLEAVNTHKIAKIREGIQRYYLMHQKASKKQRIEVVAVTQNTKGELQGSIICYTG